MFYLIFTCVNGLVNNREAGDLRRHRAHYDVIVMTINNPIVKFHSVPPPGNTYYNICSVITWPSKGPVFLDIKQIPGKIWVPWVLLRASSLQYIFRAGVGPFWHFCGPQVPTGENDKPTYSYNPRASICNSNPEKGPSGRRHISWTIFGPRFTLPITKRVLT